jgi:hypothetical protein
MDHDEQRFEMTQRGLRAFFFYSRRSGVGIIVWVMVMGQPPETKRTVVPDMSARHPYLRANLHFAELLERPLVVLLGRLIIRQLLLLRLLNNVADLVKAFTT